MPYSEQNALGFKRRDTSQQAAASLRSTAALMREKCHAALVEYGPMTADEIAAKIEYSVLSVRPRITELINEGRIKDTGLRRPNASGRTAAVWKANPLVLTERVDHAD